MAAPSPDPLVRHLRASRGPRRHPLVMPSLVLALIPCCPPAGLLGAMLGIIALRGIRLRPDLHLGRRLAITAILIGCVHAIVTAGLLQSFAQRQQDAQRRVARDLVRQVITDEAPTGAPVRPLFADSSGINAAEVEAFRAFLETQYGRFEQFTPAVVTQGGTMLRPQLDMAGAFTFDGKPLLGAVRFDVTVQPPSMQTRLRLQWMRIGDEAQGRLGPVPDMK